MVWLALPSKRVQRQMRLQAQMRSDYFFSTSLMTEDQVESALAIAETSSGFATYSEQADHNGIVRMEIAITWRAKIRPHPLDRFHESG